MRFTIPRDVYHGKGALAALKDFEGKRLNSAQYHQHQEQQQK